MAVKYLKKSPKTSSTDDTKTAQIVQGLLNDLEKSKEHNFLKRMSVISDNLNLSIFFYNCETSMIDEKLFKERLLIDNL